MQSAMTLPTTLINVAIVDDHRMLVEGIVKAISESGVATVTGTYHSLAECRIGLARSLPEVLLLDIHLPDGNGVEFCTELRELYPQLKILMLTSFGELSIPRRALHNGAMGYVLKNALIEEVIEGIVAVHAGEEFLCDEISRMMKKTCAGQAVWLTSREKEMLQLIAKGFSNPEIAQMILLSEETVKTYRKNLLLKFQARNSVDMVLQAIEQKLI